MKISTRQYAYLVLALGLFCFSWASAAAPVKVAVLPFQIHSDKDYGFLQKGIAEMLASRLYAPGKVEIIDPVSTAQAMDKAQGLSGDSLALKVADGLKADFVIHGSITALGDSASIDAKMLDVSGGRPPLTFFKQTQGIGEVIPQINLLANDINFQIFGRQPLPSSTAAAPTAQPPVATQTAPVQQPDVHMHPEKLLQNGRPVSPSGDAASPLSGQNQASPLNPAFVATPGSTPGSAQFWKSQNFDYLINGLDVGDVNGDGLLETVVAAPDKVLVYQFKDGRLRQLADIKSPRFVINIGVDVGDVNGNGIPEIFVTAMNPTHDALASYVVEWTGSEFKTIVSKALWYYRTQKHPERGITLLGQHQTFSGVPNAAPVVYLEWQGVEYQAGAPVLPGGKANLLGLALGDLMADRSVKVLAFTETDKLRVMHETNGQTIWTGGDDYGGSTVYFELPPETGFLASRSYFMPVRIRITDLDRDGKPEAVVPQNFDRMGRMLAEQRFYNKSRIVALQWDGLGLTPIWQTGEISGRTQDLAIADFDNDGKLELVAAVVTKEGAVVTTKPQSALIAYDLKSP